MGTGICAMHYTGMFAMRMSPPIQYDPALFIASAFDAHFAAHTARLADSLQVANEQLRNVALYDSLTGLPNRFLLRDRLDQAVARADRNAKPFALMFLDLDRFKPVNDLSGHAVGDSLLQAVAERLARCVRKDDTVARTGGDEFVVVLSQISSAGDAARISDKILDALSRPFQIEGHELEISCSIGIGVYPHDGKNVSALLNNADAAMYRAKNAGRNKFEFFAAGEVGASVPGSAR